MKHPIPKPSATFDPIDACWRALLEDVQELKDQQAQLSCGGSTACRNPTASGD